MDTQVIKQGLYWLAEYVRDNIELSVVDSRGIEFHRDNCIMVYLRIHEFYDNDEDAYYLGQQLETSVGRCLRELPKNYYPPQIHFYATIEDKGWATVFIEYAEGVYR